MRNVVYNIFIAISLISASGLSAQPGDKRITIIDVDNSLVHLDKQIDEAVKKTVPHIVKVRKLKLSGFSGIEAETMKIDSIVNEFTIHGDSLYLPSDLDKKIGKALSGIGPEGARPFKFRVEPSDITAHPGPSKSAPAGIVIEKTKVITKTYAINSDDKLILNNQYGNIHVITSSKNEFKVIVEIKAFEGSESRAQDLLDDVSINESKQPNAIGLTTIISKSNSMNFWIRRSGDKEERRGLQINYTVYIPSKNALDIKNKYGSITLPDFAGRITINSSYGSLKAESLTNTGNSIKISYGSGDIESLNSGNLKVSYGSIDLGATANLNADIEYSSGRINRLSGNGDLNLKYCSDFKVAGIDSKNLNADIEYSTLSLRFMPETNLAFDVSTNYGEFKNRNNKAIIQTNSEDNKTSGFDPSRNYKGHLGNGSGGKVIVRSSYGSVIFL